ncbi:MAG TPA: hypothetical protein VEC99_09510 [Clostridia bacterium]|nr:hypothetical protein [Clostridia bacterium]
MVVMREKALQEEHDEKSTQSVLHGLAERMVLMDGMRNKVEQSHPEHEPGDKTHRHLQPCVRQTHGKQNPATC